MKPHLNDLFEYNFISNEQLINYLLLQTAVPEQALKLISHLINAHQIWLARILDQPSRSVWEIHTLHENQQLNTDNYLATKTLLLETDLETSITYSNTQGVSYNNTIKDILFHIINHSTYHRAQIASILKSNGITPLVSDYIVYKRPSKPPL